MNTSSRVAVPKLMTLVVIAVLTFSIVSHAAKVKVTHLHDMSHQNEWTEWLRNSEKLFEEANPDIDIEIMSQSRASQLEKLILLYGTGEHPDVTEVIPTEHYKFALDGMFQDLNPWMKRETNLSWDEFFPVALDAATIIATHPGAGQRWMLPISLWVTGAGINESQLAESGLKSPSTMEHHWTWSEFSDYGRKLTRYNSDGSIARHGVGLNTYPYWIHNAGGSVFDRLVDPTKATLNTDPVRKALTFIEDAYHISRYARRSATVQQFASGAISIYMHAGPSTTPSLRSARSNFEYSYAPNPKLVRGGSENVAVGLGLSSQSKNPEAAWKWMKFLATEAARDHIAFTGRPVAWGPVARNYRTYFKNPSVWEAVWIELISRPDSYNRMVANPEVIRVWETYLREVLDGKTAVESMIQKAQSHLTAILPTYRMQK